jgi:hypothetical protein
MARRRKTAYVVTLSGERPIHEVSEEIRAAGLEIKDILEHIGSITGAADPSALDKLRAVRGVIDISEDQPIDIGPPDSSVS